VRAATGPVHRRRAPNLLRPQGHGRTPTRRLRVPTGQGRDSWKQLGAVGTISGVGFWDKPHTQNPHAPNFAELHPVTAIKFTSGCGAWRRQRLRGPFRVRPFGPLCRPGALCITVIAMPDDTEAHQYRLGSPLASIVGIAESTLERNDLDEDVATRLRAIRDLALDALRGDRRGDDPGSQPTRPQK
jgi:hypothetical protein